MAIDVEKLKAVSTPTKLPFRIAKLGHLVLQVRDLERSARFYREVLGLTVVDVYPEAMVPGGMVFLRCNTDHHCLALVGAASSDAANLELHHFAFEVASLDEVVRMREHLRAHGVEIDFEGRRRAGCQIAVEFRDPDGHNVEVYWGLDQVGSDGRVRPADEWLGATSLEEAIARPVPGQDTTRFDS